MFCDLHHSYMAHRDLFLVTGLCIGYIVVRDTLKTQSIRAGYGWPAKIKHVSV